MSAFWDPESNQDKRTEHGPSGDASGAVEGNELRRFTPTLRGRARSDIHNAKRRADANKSKNDHGEDNSGR